MKRIYACILIVAALLAVSLYGRRTSPPRGRHLPRVQNCAIPCGKL